MCTWGRVRTVGVSLAVVGEGGLGRPGLPRRQPVASKGQLESPRWEKAVGRKQEIIREEPHHGPSLAEGQPRSFHVAKRYSFAVAAATGPGGLAAGRPRAPLLQKNVKPGGRRPGRKPVPAGAPASLPGRGGAQENRCSPSRAPSLLCIAAASRAGAPDISTNDAAGRQSRSSQRAAGFPGRATHRPATAHGAGVSASRRLSR